MPTNSSTDGALPWPPPGPEALLGQRVAGRFRLLSVLGCGGMSWVYRAEQEPTGRVVALKILAPERSTEADQRRLEREATLMARLHHPHVAEVYDAGRWEGLAFVAMEVVRGHSLGELLELGPLQPERALRLTRQLASALREVHALGVVHRDLSVHNVVVQDPGQPREQVKLLDFGLARDLSGGEELTAAGQLLGSAHAIAPESLRGAPPAPAADLYALGVLLYTALSGQPPFAEEQPARVLQRKQAEEAPELRPELPLPAELRGLLRALLAQDPRRRPAEAEAVERALRAAERALREPHRPAAPPAVAPAPGWGWYTLALLLGVALGALGLTALGWLGHG